LTTVAVTDWPGAAVSVFRVMVGGAITTAPLVASTVSELLRKNRTS
jgi:hypothetical protein